MAPRSGLASSAPVFSLADWGICRRPALALVTCTLAAAIAAWSVLSTSGPVDETTPQELSWPLSDRPLAGSALAAQGAPSDAQRQRLAERYGKLPLAFEHNRGQTDGRVDFVARAPGHTAFLTSTGATLALQADEPKGAALRVELTGANPAARPVALERLPGEVTVLRGNNPSEWVSGAGTFARVRYQGVYPGIDLAWYGTQGGRLEYDFIVGPGADPSAIELELEGAQRVKLSDAGALQIKTAAGTLVQRPPVAYQQIEDGRRRVESRYVLSDHRVLIALGEYDHERPLVIDPVLAYSTYLGGGGNDDGLGIAVDGAGSAYVTGLARSSDFPTTPGAFDTTSPEALDAFVTKLNPAGSALTYSTYLGGDGFDQGRGIAIDDAGSAYVTGIGSSGFPVTPGAFDTTGSGGPFVTKLTPTGSALAYSTFLDGADPYGITVDATGSAYVTGRTEGGIPTTPGAFDTTYNGGSATPDGLSDVFVTKFDPTGSGLAYSTYLGGSDGGDWGRGIAVDAIGSAYVGGETSSTDFPTSPGAFDPTANGDDDGFAAKLDPAGAALAYSTYLGGTGIDEVHAVAVDGADGAYVTGRTRSANFPTTVGAFDTTGGFDVSPSGQDAFVTKLAPGGAPAYSTYLAGNDTDIGRGIAVDSAGSAHVTGTTRSGDFPTTPGAFGPNDIFVTKLDPAGSAPTFSTFLGGSSSNEEGFAIAADPAGAIYVTGFTGSGDFPTTPGAFDTTLGGFLDAFVTKLEAGPETIFTAGPSGTTNDPTPTFAFSSEPGSTFQCKVDAGPYANCSSPRTTAHLADGPHTFYVRATKDSVTGPPASRAFTVRTAAVRVSGSTLVVQAAPGAKDNLRITRPSPSTLRVTDLPGGAYTGSGVHVGAGCTRSGDYTANCDAAGVTRIKVYSRVRIDRVINSTAIQGELRGGMGDDVLIGGSNKDTLFGAPGADVMRGMNGDDNLQARDLTSDTTIDCGGGTADKADLDLLPKDPNSAVIDCETKTRH